MMLSMCTMSLGHLYTKRKKKTREKKNTQTNKAKCPCPRSISKSSYTTDKKTARVQHNNKIRINRTKDKGQNKMKSK